MDDLECEKHVDYVFKTPSGAILRMKNGAAIVIRGKDAEIFSSLEEYHAKHQDNSQTWNELADDKDKRQLYAANAAALKKIKWIEVETAVAAARKLETVEKRKSLLDWLVGRRNDLLNAIVSLPLVIFVVWGLAFGLERAFGVTLSHFQNSTIAVVAVVIIFRCVPKNPGRATLMMAAFGYLLIGLAFWMYG